MDIETFIADLFKVISIFGVLYLLNKAWRGKEKEKTRKITKTI